MSLLFRVVPLYCRIAVMSYTAPAARESCRSGSLVMVVVLFRCVSDGLMTARGTVHAFMSAAERTSPTFQDLTGTHYSLVGEPVTGTQFAFGGVVEDEEPGVPGGVVEVPLGLPRERGVVHGVGDALDEHVLGDGSHPGRGAADGDPVADLPAEHLRPQARVPQRGDGEGVEPVGLVAGDPQHPLRVRAGFGV